MPECKKCGGCCSRMIIEVYDFDVTREPRIKEHLKQYQSDSDYAGAIVVNGDVALCNHPCPFLEDNACQIYPTRPTSCVAFEPGGEQCLEFQR